MAKKSETAIPKENVAVAADAKSLDVDHLTVKVREPEILGMVTVQRQWNDWRRIEVSVSALSGFHIATVSGGVQAPSPRPMLYAYMSCSEIPQGAEFAHSCMHGSVPHRIKVCITRKYNPTKLYRRLRELA
jgi:hypothetical protein